MKIEFGIPAFCRKEVFLRIFLLFFIRFRKEEGKMSNFKRFILKGMIVIMALLSTILGLVGCSNQKENNYNDEFGYEGNDFSKEGPGEYKKIVGFNYNVGGYGPNYAYTFQKSEEDENTYVFECVNYEESIKDASGELDDETILKWLKSFYRSYQNYVRNLMFFHGIILMWLRKTYWMEKAFI